MSLRKLFFSLIFLALPSWAAAEDIHIVGDSIGEGVHMATNYPSPANRFNVAIYTPFIFQQLKQMPRGATVFMSLGTNDAVGGLTDVKARVDQIVATAQEQGIKLIWMGPPCVRKDWEVHSRKLDEILAAQLKGTPVTYVSLQGPEFCEASLHAGDGVHFTMAGYALMWQKAATAAGIPVVVASAATTKSAAPVAHPRHRGKHKKKHVPAKPPTPPAPH